MKRVGLIAAALFALGASDAQAHTTITCEPCSRPYQRWVDEAKVPTPDVTLTVVEAPCPELAEDFAWACTAGGAYTIWDADPQTDEPKETFLHELGHNFDYYTLPQWARERFQWLVGDTRYWTADPNGPNEHFASAYAYCALTGSKFRGDPDLLLKGNGGGIRQITYRRICRMIQNIGWASDTHAPNEA